MYYKVKEDERLVRDSRNNSILNTDVKALKKHEIIMKERENSKKFVEEISNMKSEISELKEMLKLLINREK